MDYLRLSAEQDSRGRVVLREKYEEPSKASSAWGFFTPSKTSVGTLKAAASFTGDADLLANLSETVNDVVTAVVPRETLRETTRTLGTASAVAALPTALKKGEELCRTAKKFAEAPKFSGLYGLGMSVIKFVKEWCEVLCGFAVKSAKAPKSLLSCVIDVDGISNSVSSKRALDPSNPEKPFIDGYHEATESWFTKKIIKNVSGLAFHITGVATSVFAAAVSPYLAATLGTVYLLACIVEHVASAEVKNLDEKCVRATLIDKGVIHLNSKKHK